MKKVTEEEGLNANNQKFDENGNRIHESLSYEKMQAILKKMYSGELQVIGPDGKVVNFDDKKGDK